MKPYQRTMMMSDLSLTTSRVIAAPADRVFNAWLEPDMLVKFMTPDTNVSVPSAKTDPVVGGRFDLVMKAGDNEIPHAGTYLEINRHSRLVFTWESPFSTEGSTVSLDFDPVADGTKVTLTHVKFLSEETRENHNAGWTKILKALGAALAES